MTKIIAVHSYRGGTGNSIIAANLAAQAALRGSRVGLVDTNFQNPGLFYLFGLDDPKEELTLNHFLQGEITVKEVVYDVGKNAGDQIGRQKLKGKPLWLVPASNQGHHIADILRNGYDVNLLNDALVEIAEMLKLDYLFVDSYPGLNEETLLSFVIADMLIVNMVPSRRYFQGTAVTIDIARSLDVADINLIVTKVLSKYDPAQIIEQVENSYNTPVAGVLPFSEDVFEVDHEDLFSLAYPEHPWSEALLLVANKLF